MRGSDDELIVVMRSPLCKRGGRGDSEAGMLPCDRSLKKISRDLRGAMTDAERLLWSRIRRKQIKGQQFYRQKIIGRYVADFYCPKAKLVVEIDGGQHFAPLGEEADRARDAFMEGLGLRVLRFSDREVFQNLDGVLERIWETSRG